MGHSLVFVSFLSSNEKRHSWVTGTVQECELSEQPGEVSQSPANLFTFLGTCNLLVKVCELFVCYRDSSHSRFLWQTFQGIL